MNPLADASRSHFGAVDAIVLLLYGAILLGIGYYFSRRQRTTEEYFVGGRKKRPFIAGVSAAAATVTVVSYISTPGEFIQNGPVFVFANLAAIPFAFVVVGWFVVPAIMRHPITSAYELLEVRLGLGVRKLGAVSFICIQVVWMSLVLYTAASVLANVMGWDRPGVLGLEMAIGMVTTLYTVAGGIDTVMVTSVLQFFVLLLGGILTIVSVAVHLGGPLAWLPHHWQPHWAPQPFFSLSPHVRVTVIGAIASHFVFKTCIASSDQVVVQRYLTTGGAGPARRSLLHDFAATICFILLLGAVGAALLAFFQRQAGGLPAGLSLAKRGDAFFPYYIGHQLPSGVSGLVIAGLLASAMSALSGSINSAITIISKDIIDTRRSGAKRADAVKLRTARRLSLLVGIAMVGVSMGVGFVPGNLAEVTVKTTNLFTCPMFGLFFLALFVPFATPFGAVMGAVYSLTAAVLVAYWDVFTGLGRLSFTWVMPVALLVSLAAGCLFSLLPTRGRSRGVVAAYAAGGLLLLAILVGELTHHA